MKSGQVFGRLEVVEYISSKAVRVRCQCGNEKTVQAARLRDGRTSSCGCLRAELLGARRRTHGMTEAPEFSTWMRMRQRCTDPRNISFKLYGGRGITVCDRWRESFEAFLADMGTRPEGASLDRIDPNGNYEPANCRWATPTEQCNNKRRNIRITHDGRTLTVAEWARELGLKDATLRRRLRVGEPVEKAFIPALRPGVRAS